MSNSNSAMLPPPPWPPARLTPDYRVERLRCDRDEHHEQETARLHFLDWLGRPVSVFAARRRSLTAPVSAAVLHCVGGAQTVSLQDLDFWNDAGFATASFDWQLGEIIGRLPAHTTHFPPGVVPQFSATPSLAAAVLPLALQAAAACLDWLSRISDPPVQRLGVAGISWGGYLAWLLAAYDDRVRAVVPAFGCGGLFAEGRRGPAHAPEVRTFWQEHWEPVSLAAKVRGAVCYLSATNDFFGDPLVAESLLASLAQPPIRHLLPNVDHSLDAEQSQLAIAWMRHHLLEGPALPATPVLRPDLTLASAPEHPVVGHEIWWAPVAGPGMFRCWQPTPPPADRSLLVFARVRYASGLELCTPITALPDGSEALPAAAPAAPPPGLLPFGLGWHWDVGKARFFDNDARAVPPTHPEDSWHLTPARPETNAPVTVLLHPESAALAQFPPRAGLSLGWTTPPQTEVTVLLHRRTAGASPVQLRARWHEDQLSFRPTDAADLPADFRWAEVGRIQISATLVNRRGFRIGPLRGNV